MTFKIKGITVEITFFFAALIAFMLTLRAPADVLIAVFSSLLHETGHLAAMYWAGNTPETVRFEITGMNIKRRQSTTVSMKNELIIALGGPFFNLLIFIISCLSYAFLKTEILLHISCINFVLMIFNLLPIKRLDGGMALYFFLSQKYDVIVCSKILKITSVVFVLIVYAWGFYVFAAGGYNISVIIIAIFLTLSMLGNYEY
ncbi:MAG: hypothetical protein ACI4N4_08430 [Candidatus Fimenecus sp.]